MKASDIEEGKNAIQRFLEQIEHLHKELARRDKEMLRLEEENGKLYTLLDENKKHYNILEKELSDKKRIEAALRDDADEIERLNRIIGLTGTKLQELEAKNQALELKSIREKESLHALDRKRKAAEVEIQQKDRMVEELLRSLEDSRSRNADLESKRDEGKTELQRFLEHINELRKEQARRDEEMLRLEEENGKLYTLLEENKKQFDTMRRQIASSKVQDSQLEERSHEIERLNKMLDLSRSRIEQLEGENQELELRNKIDEQNEKLRSLDREHKIAQAKLQEKDQMVQELLHKVKELQIRSMDLESTKEETEKLSKLLEVAYSKIKMLEDQPLPKADTGTAFTLQELRAKAVAHEREIEKLNKIIDVMKLKVEDSDQRARAANIALAEEKKQKEMLQDENVRTKARLDEQHAISYKLNKLITLLKNKIEIYATSASMLEKDLSHKRGTILSLEKELQEKDKSLEHKRDMAATIIKIRGAEEERKMRKAVSDEVRDEIQLMAENRRLAEIVKHQKRLLDDRKIKEREFLIDLAQRIRAMRGPGPLIPKIEPQIIKKEVVIKHITEPAPEPRYIEEPPKVKAPDEPPVDKSVDAVDLKLEDHKDEQGLMDIAVNPDAENMEMIMPMVEMALQHKDGPDQVLSSLVNAGYKEEKVKEALAKLSQ